MRSIRVVYVGPGTSGRSTSLASIKQRLGDEVELREIDGCTWHCFNCEIGGTRYAIALSISTARARLYYENLADPWIPPRVRVEAAQICVAHGVLFVIDSQTARWNGNLDEFDKLKRDLATSGHDIDNIPIVFQANKRDLDSICTMESIQQTFGTKRCAFVTSTATMGVGTLDALAALVDLI